MYPIGLNVGESYIKGQINKEWIANNVNICQKLTRDEKAQVLELLCKYPELYAVDESDCGKTNLIKHQIYTGNYKPVRKYPYQSSSNERKMVIDEIRKMLKKDIIQPSSSAWAANVVLVRKKNGTHRFCVDFIRLIEVT